MKTTVTVDCGLCGATNVPMTWSWRTFMHTAGADWNISPGSRGRRVCMGESGDEAFMRLLRNSKLALAGRGYRLMTDQEIADRETSERIDAHANGHLF